MGIKNLKKIIREKYPNEIQKMNLYDFYGKIFMMDIMSYIYKYKVAMGDKWLQSIIHLIKIFKKNNVHVNIVFEGESPVEKNKEREQRREQRKKQQQKINDIKGDIDGYHRTGIISNLLKETFEKINQTNTEKVNRLLHYNSNTTDKIKSQNITSINYKMLEQLENYIEKKEGQLVSVTEQDANKIKEICDIFGIPYFQSENEAETLCCKMCLNVKEKISSNNELKRAIGVISEDTDVLAYGANMLLCDLNISNGECNVIYLPSLLKTMELNYNEFLEFCILSGTDYNYNIPGIGSIKCLQLLNKYHSIDNIFTNEEKLIEKKINDALEKNKKKNSNNVNNENKNTCENNEKELEENEDIIDNNITIEKLYKDMKRSKDMFDLIEKIDDDINYWEPNINFNKVCELCLIYNVDSYSIEKLWTNNIKLI